MELGEIGLTEASDYPCTIFSLGGKHISIVKLKIDTRGMFTLTPSPRPHLPPSPTRDIRVGRVNQKPVEALAQ
jgi:hypothetical protein